MQSFRRPTLAKQVRELADTFSDGELMKTIEHLESDGLVEVSWDLNLLLEPIFDPAEPYMQTLFHLLSGLIRKSHIPLQFVRS